MNQPRQPLLERTAECVNGWLAASFQIAFLPITAFIRFMHRQNAFAALAPLEANVAVGTRMMRQSIHDSDRAVKATLDQIAKMERRYRCAPWPNLTAARAGRGALDLHIEIVLARLEAQLNGLHQQVDHELSDDAA